MSDPIKQLVGTLYFSPDRDARGNPISRYEGVVSGFIVRRDDGVEFEVRSETPLPYVGALKKSEVSNLKYGQILEDLDGNPVTVIRGLDQYNRVRVMLEDGTENEVAYTELRRSR